RRAGAARPLDGRGEVAHVGLEAADAEVAAPHPALGQEGVVGVADMQLGDELGGDPRAGVAGAGAVEVRVAEIVVDVPDPAAGALGGGGEQRRSGLLEAGGGEPAL